MKWKTIAIAALAGLLTYTPAKADEVNTDRSRTSFQVEALAEKTSEGRNAWKASVHIEHFYRGMRLVAEPVLNSGGTKLFNDWSENSINEPSMLTFRNGYAEYGGNLGIGVKTFSEKSGILGLLQDAWDPYAWNAYYPNRMEPLSVPAVWTKFNLDQAVDLELRLSKHIFSKLPDNSHVWLPSRDHELKFDNPVGGQGYNWEGLLTFRSDSSKLTLKSFFGDNAWPIDCGETEGEMEPNAFKVVSFAAQYEMQVGKTTLSLEPVLKYQSEKVDDILFVTLAGKRKTQVLGREMNIGLSYLFAHTLDEGDQKDQRVFDPRRASGNIWILSLGYDLGYGWSVHNAFGHNHHEREIINQMKLTWKVNETLSFDLGHDYFHGRDNSIANTQNQAVYTAVKISFDIPDVLSRIIPSR